jgi:hypothetical protein
MAFVPEGQAIVAKHEVPLESGHLKRGTLGDLCPEGGYRFSPGFNPGNLKINEFVLKGRGADLIKLAAIAAPKITARH